MSRLWSVRGIAAVMMLILVACQAGEPSASLSGAASSVGAAPPDLAASGTLRAGWAEFAPYEFRNPTSGEVEGLIFDLWADLAEEWNLELQDVEDAWPTITTALATDKFDVTLFVDTSERREIVDFSNPLFQSEYRLMVRAADGYETFADVDQPGNKITVTTGSATEQFLQAAVRNAEVVSVPEVGAALLQLTGGQADAMASSTDYLIPKARELPELAVTEDSFALAPWSVGVAKDSPELLEAVNRWVEAVKSSGLIEDLLAEHDLEGVFVSPPGPAS